MTKKIPWIAAVLVFVCAGVAIAAGGAVNLPQTGQTKCYNTTGAEITCTGTGQDGEIRAGVAWPNPRFTPGTGAEAECITDNLTGLMWPKNGNLPNASKTWNDAIDYPKTLTLCGHSDWRLPNVNELESLVNAGQINSAIWLNSQGFSNVQSGGFWSSTTFAYGTDYAWLVDMWGGGVYYGSKAYGRCVWDRVGHLVIRSFGGPVRQPHTVQGMMET